MTLPASSTDRLDAALRVARAKGTLVLLLVTAVVVGLFLARRDTATAVAALVLVASLVALRVRSWVRLLHAGDRR